MKALNLLLFTGIQLLSLCLFFPLYAQRGASSASVSMAKNQIPTPDAIFIEEFINYHEHRLPLPKAGETVAMDLRWGNPNLNLTLSEAILQIGFTTGAIDDLAQIPPVNIALVIDRSGSMQSENKLEKVKVALQVFVSRLRANDTLSIVAFDHEAKVYLPAQSVGDGKEIQAVIETLQTGGSTNMHAGMVLGYQEALKHFEKGKSNRVILLTDGIANVGVVEPEKIVADSLKYNHQGVDLSTIGVGSDLNHHLLRQLARTGRGLIHFVADANDIQKVFIKEVESIMSPVAKDVSLKIEYPSEVSFVELMGYAPSFGTNSLQIPLENMNSGLTQVVLLKMKLNPKMPTEAKSQILVSVSLEFTRHSDGQKIKKEQTTYLSFEPKVELANTLFLDPEVQKNYTIGKMAKTLKMVAKLVHEKAAFEEAYGLLNQQIEQMEKLYPQLKDTDLQFMLNYLKKYKEGLDRYRPFSKLEK